MQKNENCLCCKTYFQDGEKLPLEDLIIQLKNYTYPIKDQKHRWILLKTIVSMLNSRGGTIFIGAEDKTGQVRGLAISRKQQDEFKLFIQKLTERIQPAVDLSNREDIIMHFLPVMENETFTGRYLAKIIVKQGDPNRLYCITQKVVLQEVNNKKYDDFQVVYSYKRINMGSVKELSGYEVVAEAAYRALNPPKIVNIFHEGCNPEPRNVSNLMQGQKAQPQSSPNHSFRQAEQTPSMQDLVQEDITLLFTNIKDRETRQKLQDQLDSIMDKLSIKNYNSSYDDENSTVILEFSDRKSWNTAMDYIDGNLHELNYNLQSHAKFSKKTAEEDYAIYENQRGNFGSKEDTAQIQEVNENENEAEEERQGRENLLSPPAIEIRSKSLEQQVSKNQRKNHIQKEKKTKAPQTHHHEYVEVPSNVNIDITPVLTITHLNPARKQQLIQYIQGLNDCKKKIQQYQKTIQVAFETKQAFSKCYLKFEKSKDLTKFGFKGVLRFGINVSQITMQNYDKKKYREFKVFITKLVGQDMKRCEFIKKGDKYTLVLTLKTSEKAAKWLDRLIVNKQIKNFRIPGGVQSKKMKIDLVCVKPKISITRKQSQHQ